MTITTKLIRTVAGAAAVVAFLAGTADAQQMKAVSPQPGQCKTTAETVLGGSPQQASTAWEYAVKAKFGINWSRWPAAQNKVVMQHGNATTYLVQGRPCYTIIQ